MNHIRLADAPEEPASSEHFTLPASRHDLIAVDEPRSSALLVRFGPGGRTVWHDAKLSDGKFGLSGCVHYYWDVTWWSWCCPRLSDRESRTVRIRVRLSGQKLEQSDRVKWR